MSVALVSLVAGLIVGYVGQRTRMCFVGGLRDVILVRDRELLKGLVAFAVTAWLAFPVAHAVAGGGARFFLGAWPDVWTAVAGGGLVGVLSVVANGCPLRQHVMAGQGNVSAMVYLTGFLAGACVFHLFGPTLVAWVP
jgi:YedE family putative selenium metabolism protein